MRWLLTHQAGVLGLDEPISHSQLLNWNYVIVRLAFRRPDWRPGSEHGRHTMSYGLLDFRQTRAHRRCSPDVELPGLGSKILPEAMMLFLLHDSGTLAVYECVYLREECSLSRARSFDNPPAVRIGHTPHVAVCQFRAPAPPFQHAAAAALRPVVRQKCI